MPKGLRFLDRDRPRYSENQMRFLRDGDRRIYRTWVIILIFSQIFIGAPVRIAADVLMDKLHFGEFKTYNIGIILVMIGLMWTVGIWTTFRRRY